MQQKVDARIRELNHSSHLSGKSKKLKYKSQRGGSVDVQVKHKVHWPHEAVLGGVSRQRVTYDQLSLTQWVQGFCRNILEERSGTRKDTMISYLADLMEDATDFTWQGAKASHAVLLCEMERGTLQWEDGDRIDRIRRAHAQKHIPVAKSTWSKNERKPWFCKQFQSNTCTQQKDHEVNGRLNRHICAFCLTLRKQFACNQVIKSDIHRDRFVYNSGVKPKEIETLFAQKADKKRPNITQVSTVHGQVIWASMKAAQNNEKIVQKPVKNGNSVDKSSKVMSDVEIPSKCTSLPNCIGSNECVVRVTESSKSHIQDSNPSLITNATAEVDCNVKLSNVNRSPDRVANDQSLDKNTNAGLNDSDSSPSPLTSPAAEVISCPRGKDPLPGGYTHQCGFIDNTSIDNNVPAKVIIPGERVQHVENTCVRSDNGSSVNSVCQKVSERCENTDRLIFDVTQSGVEDKFVNSILHARHAIDVNKLPNIDSDIFHKWRRQSAFNFGFVSLGVQLMPESDVINDGVKLTPIEMHHAVRRPNKPNFMLARIPVKGQLNVEAWCEHLGEYWDQQLLQLIRYGFSLDFNRACNIKNKRRVPVNGHCVS